MVAGTSALRLLTFITLLWLVGVAFLANAWVIGIVALVPGLLILIMCFRQARRAQWGDVAAWAAVSLAPLGLLALVSLTNVHLHEFFGVGPGCDYMSQVCGPQVVQGIVHTLSLAAFVVAAAATVRLIAISQRLSEALITPRE